MAEVTILEKKTEARKKNENNIEWRPQLLAYSIIIETLNECLFLHMQHTVSALMSQIDQNRSSNLTLCFEYNEQTTAFVTVA